MNRVYITGIGMVTPAGMDTETTWRNMLAGQTRVEKVPENWHEHDQIDTGIWSVLPPECNFQELFSRADNRSLDPVSMLSILAADSAVASAGLEVETINRRRGRYRLNDVEETGIFIGTGIGGAKTFLANVIANVFGRIKQQVHDTTDDKYILALMDKIRHPRRVSEFGVSMLMPNAPAAAVGIRYGVDGAVRSVTQSCASGTTAIGMAYRDIRLGNASFAIAGGAEYLRDDHGSIYKGFDCARTLASVQDETRLERNVRPFDEERTGFLYAEGGAAALVLESERSLERRKVTPIAEITGYAETFDHYSMMIPDPSGEEIERMIRMALDDAGITPDEVDYVNAHGTGTIANDKTEAAVIERVFGKNVAVNSTKSIIGHTFGASGAIEAAVCALSLRDQVLHPSLNLENPIADLDFVTERRKAKLKYAFSESFAFGGHNSGLVLQGA